MRIRSVLLACSLILGLTVPSRAVSTPIFIVKDGQPTATIVIADTPMITPLKTIDKRGEKHPQFTTEAFAEEFQFWIEYATGAKLPVVKASKAPATGTLILLGESTLTQKAGLNSRNLKPEGFRVQTHNRGVALLGDVVSQKIWGANCRSVSDQFSFVPNKLPDGYIDRGIGHAVFETLEHFFGFNFTLGVERSKPETIPLGTTIPKTKTLSFPANTHLEKHPAFTFRFGVQQNREDVMSWYRCFRTGASADLGANHTHVQWHQKYAKTHRDIFAICETGVPYFEKKHPSTKFFFRSALCYDHPKVLELELDHIEHYDKHNELSVPGRMHVTPHLIKLYQADGKWWDYTPRSQKWLIKDADLFGTHSDLWFQYVEKVANVAKERWPQRRVLAAAYNRSRNPPTDRVNIPDNVDVFLAMNRSSGVANLPVYFKENENVIGTWSKLLGNNRNRLALWDYICWPQTFSHAPFLYPHTLQKWLKRFEDQIAGEFVNPGAHPEVNQLMYVLWHKLLWNPNLDVDQFITDHCHTHFGPAGPFVEKVYRLASKRYQETIWTDKIGGANAAVPHDVIHTQIFTPDIISKFETYFAQAYAALKNESNTAYKKRLDAIYDPHNQSITQNDGWASFIRSAKNFHAQKTFAKVPLGKTLTLYNGEHIETGTPGKGDPYETQVTFRKSGGNLTVSVSAKNPADIKIKSQNLTLHFFDVPAAKAKNKGGDQGEGFLRAEYEKVDTKVLPITIIPNGKTSHPDVATEITREKGLWKGTITIPLKTLGLDSTTPSVMFNVTRAINRKGVWDQKLKGILKDPYKIRMAYTLKAGFVWDPFRVKLRAPRLLLQ